MLRKTFLSLAVALVAGAMAQSEGDAKSLFLLGNEYFRGGQYDAALVAFTQATEQDPNLAEAWYGQGRSYLKLGDSSGAAEAFREAIARSPRSAAAYVGLAQALVTHYQNDPQSSPRALEEALQVLDAAQRVDSGYAAIYNERGRIFVLQGRNAEAAQSFEQARLRAPEDPVILTNLALVKRNQGEFELSRQLLEQAVAIAPEDARIRAEYGSVLARTGALERAHFEIDQAIRLEPENSVAWKALGELGYLQKDYQVAQEALSRAIEIDPVGNPEAYALLGRVALDTKDPATARFHLSKAVLLDEDNAAYRYWLGRANAELGDRAGACTQYAEALRLQPDSQGTRNAARALGCSSLSGER